MCVPGAQLPDRRASLVFFTFFFSSVKTALILPCLDSSPLHSSWFLYSEFKLAARPESEALWGFVGARVHQWCESARLVLLLGLGVAAW